MLVVLRVLGVVEDVGMVVVVVFVVVVVVVGVVPGLLELLGGAQVLAALLGQGEQDEGDGDEREGVGADDGGDLGGQVGRVAEGVCGGGGAVFGGGRGGPVDA